MEKRLWIPDYLKGWAVIIMIQGHIMETCIRQDVLDTGVGKMILLINHIPAAPLFMLLMGYLVFYTRKASGRLMQRGLQVFFWGFLLNVGLNFHYLLRIFSGKVAGNIWQALWGADILFLAGISLGVLALVKMLPKAWFWSLLFSGAIAFSAPLLNQILDAAGSDSYLFALVGSSAPWSYFPIFPWLAYPLAGFAFAGLAEQQVVQNLGKGWKVLLTVVLAGVSSIGFILHWNDLRDLAPYYHHGFPVYAWALSFSLGLVLLLQFLPALARGGFSAWIQFAGRYLTRYYVIQWLLIGNLASFFFQGLGVWAYFVGFLVVSAFTTGLVYLLKDQKLKL